MEDASGLPLSRSLDSHPSRKPHYHSLDKNHMPHFHFHGTHRQHGDHDEIDEVFADEDEEDELGDSGGGVGFHILDLERGDTPSSQPSSRERQPSKKRGKRRLFQFPVDSPATPAGDWQSLDVYQSLASVARHPSMIMEMQKKKRPCYSLLWRMTETISVLALTGIITACITLLVNLGVYHFSPIRSLLVLTLANNHLLGCLAFTGFVVTMSLASLLITMNICPEAIGGGIPDVKTVLSGLVHPTVLSLRLVVAKMLGLLFALVGGLSVGKEGPFVHVAVAIADSVMRLKPFSHCRKDTSKRLEILGCACAAGVASTFGTPFGGVLFSVEATSTTYLVRNLPRAFFTAVCAGLVYNLSGMRETFSLFTEDHMFVVDYTAMDLLLSTLLGAFSGLAGSLFVGLIQKLSELRNNFLRFSLGHRRINRRRFLLVLGATALAGPLIFIDMIYGIQEADRAHSLSEIIFQSNPMGFHGNLAAFCFLKFVTTALCVCLPLPVGLFTPVFLTGGAIGRLVGEAINHYDTKLSTFRAWEFAVIGAAAFSSGVVRSISTAIIVFELSTTSYHLRLPMSVAILVAYFIGNRFTKNIYDALLDTNGTPYLPEIPPDLYLVPASKVMKPIDQLRFLTLESTLEDALNLIADYTEPLVPVVDSVTSMALEGAVLLDDLKTAVAMLHSRIRRTPTGAEANGSSGSGRRRQAYFLEFMEEGKVHRLAPKDVPIHFLVMRDCTFLVHVKPRQQKVLPGLANLDIIMDASPYQIAQSMMLSKIDLCFRMLKLNQAYVVCSGRLVGVITRSLLIQFLDGRERRPLDRCKQLCDTCLEFFFCCCCFFTRKKRVRRASSNALSSGAVLESTSLIRGGSL